jgi:predicted transcriptional regulator
MPRDRHTSYCQRSVRLAIAVCRPRYTSVPKIRSGIWINSTAQTMASSDRKPAPGSKAPPSSRREEERRSGLSRRVVALSYPLRAELLRELVERDLASPSELARKLNADLGKVSYHIKRLVELECAELVETRPAGGALEHFYRATELHVIDESEWQEIDSAIADDILCGNVQMIMDDFVASKKAGIVGSDPDCHVTRTPMVLDVEGVREGLEHFEACRLEMSEIQRRCTERQAGSARPPIPITSSLFFFKMPGAGLDPDRPGSDRRRRD